jgi:catechol 2,3-dioxygenase-like lactoylglutathione lyase family enzyme
MEPALRIEIFPADIDRSLAFYTRLGFTLIGRRDEPVPYAWLKLGAVRVGMAQREAIDPARRTLPIGTELVVEVDDVRAERDRVRAADIPLVEDLARREWGLTDFRLTDPDGYYWRFTSRD